MGSHSKELPDAYVPNPLLFIKEVAKYFMDFLETDFHKQRAPKRSIRFKDPNNLLIGIALKKYPVFYSKIWQGINHAFSRSIPIEIQRGTYRTEIPKDLVELIRLRIGSISADEVSRVVSGIGEEIRQVAFSHSKEYDKALNMAIEAATRAIQKEVVFPLISNLEKPLQNLELGDENRIFLMQEELTAILSELLVAKISELLRLTLAEQPIDTDAELHSVFELAEVQSKALSFFESFKVGDLFVEIFEMERNRQILDKQEFYLYFCDISFENAKFPIFYIPLTLVPRENSLTIEFDAQVYVNKRALEYVVQETNQQEDRRGTLKACSERIIYLTQHGPEFPTLISTILQELMNVLQLDGGIDVRVPTSQVAKSQSVRVSNSCYLALFDKADEALVNDYEEILSLLSLGKDNPLADAFQKLIDDFINRDPDSFNLVVEDEWDESTPSEKLVFNSPIPLNSEQRQILSALNKDSCKYITVEGPPGTGKSHTITAVVFDAIQKDQSVLVLSDKKEALDVVEDKITETMNRVRFDKQFQNPILRLGRTGSTYSEILSAASIDNIKTHFRAVKTKYESIENDVVRNSNSLKEDIEAEVLSYGEVDLAEIRELIDLETLHNQHEPAIELSEFLSGIHGVIRFDELRGVCAKLKEIFRYSKSRTAELAKTLELLGWHDSEPQSASAVDDTLTRAVAAATILNKLQTLSEKNLECIALFEIFSGMHLATLRQTLQNYDDCRSSVFGYLFRGRRVEELDNSAQASFRFRVGERPHKLLPALHDAFNTFTSINLLIEDGRNTLTNGFDLMTAIHQFLIHKELCSSLQRLTAIYNDCLYLRDEVFPSCPKTLTRAGIEEASLVSMLASPIASLNQIDGDQLVRHISLHQKLHKAFADVPTVNYGDQQSNIEDLVTIMMTHLLDGRVIEFYENNKATAKTLRDIIRTKRQFPREEFGKLRKAFPCILAGIRDYAEYIPLEEDLFDLLIIDEASQVSVSQAFPALLRAKKVLILGDRKQFSNVKAAQARSDTNREYVNHLRGVFAQNISHEQAKLVRLEKFNIKASILDFFEFITNYHIQLTKYFRGYKEIISYSNAHFYKDSLQVMKIRGKPIDDVLKFTIVAPDGRQEPEANTNRAEVDFIVSELRKLKETDSSVSIGIITPHTNQQKLLIETINKLPEREFLFRTLRLKIMTFDTCQGEERDRMFYSMVATRRNDRLWGIFIKDLKTSEIEEEGQIKAQRLNVGFSRAKECMHFVLSKELNEYTGSIGEALRHYSHTLNEAKKEKSVLEVDSQSAMEPLVLHWFYQTSFWHNNKEKLEIIPQFAIGKYLKQLEKSYVHPMYRVDFLLIFREEHGTDRKIILEYDGFLEHFSDLPGINSKNYEQYYSEEDVYRKKVLEGYGYRFLRINRFNVGKDPVQTLNHRLLTLLNVNNNHSTAIEVIQTAYEGLQNGDLKECPKCKQLHPFSDFENKSLVSGYGRFCKSCRPRPSTTIHTEKGKAIVPSDAVGKMCTRCGSRMVPRNGRYGRFLGCSRYPYCKATLTA